MTVQHKATSEAGEPREPGTARRGAAGGPTGSSAPPGGDALRVSTAQIAEQFGVSRRMLFYADRVSREAPELHEAIRKGEVSVTDADAIRRRPESERRDALEAVRRGTVKTLQAYFGQTPRVVRFGAPLAARAEEYLARVGRKMTFQEFAQTVLILALDRLERDEEADSADLHGRDGGQ